MMRIETTSLMRESVTALAQLTTKASTASKATISNETLMSLLSDRISIPVGESDFYLTTAFEPLLLMRYELMSKEGETSPFSMMP